MHPSPEQPNMHSLIYSGSTEGRVLLEKLSTIPFADDRLITPADLPAGHFEFFQTLAKQILAMKPVNVAFNAAIGEKEKYFHANLMAALKDLIPEHILRQMLPTIDELARQAIEAKLVIAGNPLLRKQAESHEQQVITDLAREIYNQLKRILDAGELFTHIASTMAEHPLTETDVTLARSSFGRLDASIVDPAILAKSAIQAHRYARIADATHETSVRSLITHLIPDLNQAFSHVKVPCNTHECKKIPELWSGTWHTTTQEPAEKNWNGYVTSPNIFASKESKAHFAPSAYKYKSEENESIAVETICNAIDSILTPLGIELDRQKSIMTSAASQLVFKEREQK